MIASADRFFRRLGYILIVYVILMIFFYPYLVKNDFSFLFIMMLIVAISIKSFAQYFFGITNRLLLLSDQKGYIYYFTQALTVILNTLMCYFFIYHGNSIQIVYFTTSIVFLLQPIAVYIYVTHTYPIDRKIRYEQEPIKQKWNGIAQHVAAVILTGSGSIILSIFSTLSNVSIYSVYCLPVAGSRMLIMSMISGIQALIGNLWAKRDFEELNKVFTWTEWIIHTGTTVIFTVTAILIVPFVRIYTNGINDADYIQTNFAVILVLANSLHCYRLPYNIMILAAGHYKQTQNNYIYASIANIIISIIAVMYVGLTGASLGMLVALLYQTWWMAWYNSNNFINWPLKKFYKQVLVDIVTAVAIFLFSRNIIIFENNYYGWILLAIKVLVVGVLVSLIINSVFFFEKIRQIINKAFKIN
ncbi:hypothetical protein [uncultured Phascolarctobacterium sp.]|uniref:hypothetical protein n=1 Tax=uncultured Phascolarctobacterium sp. TaxID=512296 RepID=UPI0025D7D4E7|nr:hypothetical protein [uncultured Phascolarctobacterium sp.]